MTCLHEDVWRMAYKDANPLITKTIQDTHHRRVEWMLNHPGHPERWHKQATYNLAVRQECRKRGLL